MRKLVTAIHAFKAIRESSERYGVSFAYSAKRFVHLYHGHRFSPYEIYFNDLLNPRISDGALEYYMSKEELIAFDKKHLLDTYMCLTSDKAVFYSLCLAAGIPAPKLLAIFDRPVGWAPDGRLLLSSADWFAFVESLPEHFIVKPALGLQGRGVTAFHRDGRTFVEHGGYRRTTEELYRFLCDAKAENLFGTSYSHHSLRIPRGSHKIIVQERLYAHPVIAELTGSVALCTCRLLTHTDPSGEGQVLASAFRAINGNNIVDNLDRGTRGNLWCSVDLSSGRIVEAFAKAEGADRLETVARHPTTRREVIGFRIPQWDEAVELALHAASVLRPQPSITWDVGITGDGPVVIEGNVGGHFLPTPLNRAVRTLLKA